MKKLKRRRVDVKAEGGRPGGAGKVRDDSDDRRRDAEDRNLAKGPGPGRKRRGMVK